jgi:tetratricopeptide (TPR) repeat protein
VPRIFRHQVRQRSVTIAVICVFLATITWLVFGQTLGHGFVNYDDPQYVYDNVEVTSGLTLHGMTWVFTHSHFNNWHPLTWLTHMLDWQLYERKAGGHHMTNLLLHTAGVLLLFLVLAQMTGALWRSAFVAATFAIHPLHVESVAWIAERKDVLSGVFFMLTLGAYVRYVRRQTFGRYAVMWILFACGLMSKPMLVTLPFVLLLLDYWPLNRVTNQRLGVGSRGSGVSSQLPSQSCREPGWSLVGHLILEKVPLLVLCVVSSVATFLAQGNAIASISRLPFWWRLNNAFLSYVVYVRQMLWPFRLAPFYTYPQTLPGWEVAVSILLLIGLTAAAIALRRGHPYLVTGWFWYLGMLVPVIGVIQVGSQAHADRYTYLPQIGLYLALTWMIADLAKSWRRRWILTATATAVIAFLSWTAWVQASYWRESESLWKHTLAVTGNNETAHSLLGDLALEKGLLDEAAAHYQAAVDVWPSSPTFQAKLGKALLRKGLNDEAIIHFQKAMELASHRTDTERAELQSDIGNELLQKGLVDEAIVQFQQALELAPADRIIHNDYGNALLRKGRVDEAIVQFQKALDSGVEDAYAPTIHYNLGNALRQKKLLSEAVAQYREALKRAPRLVAAQDNLAWTLATAPDASLRNGSQALELATQANQLSGGRDPVILRTLAAAYAENGQFSKAFESAKSALDLAITQRNQALVEALQHDISLYQTGLPYR